MEIVKAAGFLTALCFLVGSGLAAEVCWPDVGCFDDVGCHSQGYPPESPTLINTRFFLYTQQNKLIPQELILDDSIGLGESNFNAARNTKFSVHGWNSNMDSGSETARRDAWLQVEDCNVIMVDWRAGAAGADYWKQHQNTRVVGKEIGLMATFLKNAGGLQFTDVHVVGHSLGAHASGYGGESLGGMLARITGTDPAGPLFKADEYMCRLDPTDAVFVDAIHTDAGELGINIEVGHQDYWPNGGITQPGCTPAQDVGGCSHAYSNYFFTESILSTTCRFTAYPCASQADANAGTCSSVCGVGGCPEMGYRADEHKHVTGNFYLETHANSPYCMFL